MVAFTEWWSVGRGLVRQYTAGFKTLHLPGAAPWEVVLPSGIHFTVSSIDLSTPFSVCPCACMPALVIILLSLISQSTKHLRGDRLLTKFHLCTHKRYSDLSCPSIGTSFALLWNTPHLYRHKHDQLYKNKGLLLWRQTSLKFQASWDKPYNNKAPLLQIIWQLNSYVNMNITLLVCTCVVFTLHECRLLWILLSAVC